jgi:hypothetical protein
VELDASPRVYNRGDMMSDYGVTEYEGRIERILELKNKDLWVEFGRPTTPWDDENIPPSPVPGAVDVDTPYLYVEATLKTVCRPAVDNDEYVAAGANAVTVGTTQYIFVADEDAYDESARWLYVKAAIDVAGGYPSGTYRQVRLFSGLTPALGHESDAWLLPANVTDPGIRQWTDTCPPEINTAAAKKAANIIIEST